ncbi:hypothetical protein E8E13_009295 [Curvularia kusanoi]|uniref:Nicotianamine synthase n=1 Tax=Curvularia kusanoi TaxID=90978 RepID=A0A9P4TF25_CURKU|nr:hypothetical protein E8E13_009295 [Curvularia kusanoi]
MGNSLGHEKMQPRNSTTTVRSVRTPPGTPRITTAAANALATEIQDIYLSLSVLPSLAPGDEVNALFTRLVHLCTKPYDQEVITEFFNLEGMRTLCTQLQGICATAEGKLESFWATKLVTESSSPGATAEYANAILSKFPYHQNYMDLARIECNILTAFLPHPVQRLNIAFIGSGPLPLTSLCMLDIFPVAHIHNIDRDISALSISEKLSERLGHADRMSFACVDVSTKPAKDGMKTAWHKFDVVFLAALVGIDMTSKLAILEGLVKKLRPGTLVVARSAKGLREVLYPVLQLGEPLRKANLEMLVEVHPWTSVVNSVIVLKVKDH